MPLPPGAKLLSLPPGAKLVTAASAPMTETKAPSIRENYNADPTWFDKINEGATGNILAPPQFKGDDPISRVVKGVGSSLERTTKAWADALSLNPSDTTAAEMIPLLGPAAVDAVRMMSTPGQGFQGIGAAGALLAPAVASEVAARPTAAPKPPKPSKPVNVGGLMEMAKTGKDILQVLKSPNPLTKLNALGRLFEKFASEVTPIEAPPAPPVVEAPPVAPGVPVRPPLRGKQFGTFNDPTVPPVPAGVTPSGPVRPPLQGRQFGTTVAKMMREEVPGKQFGTSSQSRLVPAEVPPDAVATPQPATPAPSAAGKPVTAATLMEEATKPAGKKVPPFDWTDEAQYKEYQKALREDSNIYGNNRTSMADRVTRFMKKNGIEPTDSGIVKALEQSAEDIAVSPTTGLKRPSFNAADHEVLFDMIKDRMETPPAGAKPVASPPPTPAKAPAKPRSKQTTVGDLMGKVKK